MIQTCTNEAIGRLITYYELDQLNEKDRRCFEEHLMECGFCLQELQEMRPVISTMRVEKAEVLGRLQEEGVSFAEQKRALQEAYRDRPVKIGFEALREKLRQFLKDLRRPVVWAPAVAVALILIFLLPWGRSPNPYLPYLDYAKAPYTRVAFRGPGQFNEEAQKSFDTGMAEYTRDNYKLAIKHLQKAVGLAPNESEYWLYLGICHYIARHPQPAIEALNRALSTTDESLRAKARWYLAQAYLLKGEAGLALPLLEETAQRGGDYSARADSLLSRIRAIKP